MVELDAERIRELARERPNVLTGGGGDAWPAVRGIIDALVVAPPGPHLEVGDPK